ncbi:TrkH family potassium uptake protein [Ectothiorhodospiraceae bacterium WFHF3C12]|nr:TrkH family potassium uptake protein [Ectothiorhodospiraceae bacterium WFHF3C12]
MKPVAFGIGVLLHVPALMALLSLPVAAVFVEWSGLAAFLLTAVPALVCGQVLVWLCRDAARLQRQHAMLIAALGWVLVPVFGTVPFLVAALGSPWSAPLPGAAVFATLDSALFEAVSGFTGTGLSVVERPGELPRYLQWWRSFTEWVGGIGVIVLLLSVIPTSQSALNLYFSEAREEKILPSVKSTVRTIWSIFAVYTLIAIALLWLAGEPLWRAINHGMTGIATGGFTITDAGMEGAGLAVKLVMIPVMLFGAISFLAHYRLLRERNFRRAFGPEQRLFWILVIAGGGLLVLERFWTSGQWQIVDNAFQWVSALTTTGFATQDLTLWQPAPLLLMVVAMLVGAQTGSTGGGIKISRVLVMLKSLGWNLRDYGIRPHEVIRVRLGELRLSLPEASRRAQAAATMTAAFLLLWAVGVFLLLHFVPAGTPLAHVFFEAASAQSNVGLSTGITQAGLPAGGKLLLIVLMITGRLEIFPVMVLVAWFLGRR